MDKRHTWFYSNTFTFPAIALCLFVIALCGYGVTKLSLATDYKIFFDGDSADLMNLEQIEDRYAEIDNIFIMVTPPESIYTPDSLEVVHELTESLWTKPHVARVDSLTNYPYSQTADDEIMIDNFVYESAQITPELAKWISVVAPLEKDVLGSLVDVQGGRAGINITISMPGADPKEELLETTNAMYTLIAEFEQAYPDYTFDVTGTVAMNAEFIKAARKDFITLVPLMIVIVLIGTAFILRSVSAAFVVMCVLLLSLVGALGSAGWLGIQLSAPSISAPIIMFTVIVASSIHLISGVKRGLLSGLQRTSAVMEAYQHHAKPILVSMLTTIAGFLSMNFSDSPPFRDLGNIVALGIAFGLFICFTMLPKMLLSLNISSEGRNLNGLIDNIKGIAERVIVHQRPIRQFLIPASLLFAILGMLNVPNDDLIKYFSKDVEFRADSEQIDQHFSAIYNIGYSFDTQTENGIFAPDYLKFIEAFEAWLEEQPEVKVVNSALHRIKHLNQLINDGDPRFYQIPPSKEIAAQYFLLYEMSLPFGQEVTHQVTHDKSALKVTARLSNMSSLQMIAFEKRVSDWLEQHAPGSLSYMYSSPALIFSKISQSNVISLLEGAFIAFAMISIILAIIFRSAFIGALTLLPNLLPIGIAFGMWYLLNGQISMGLAGVTAMALGIIVDDTVHFLHQYLNGIKSGKSPEDSVRLTFERTMSAIVISSMMLVVGFALLATSSFEKNAQMGMLTGGTILLALFFDLIILPAIALRFLRRTQKANRSLNNDLHNKGIVSHEI